MATQAAAPRDHLRVAIESFRPYWEDIYRLAIRRSDGVRFDCEAFCGHAKISLNEYEMIMKSMRHPDVYLTLSFNLVDRVMVAVGMQYLMPSLYVVNERPEEADVVDEDDAPRPYGSGRLADTHARRLRIQQLWRQGWSMRRIADELGTSSKSIGATMAKMRDAGWDLPFRQRPVKDRSLVSAA
jgi:hypothetical protein